LHLASVASKKQSQGGKIMGDMNERSRASRHYAVQSLLNACFSETLFATASFLNKSKPECACTPGEIAIRLAEKGLIAKEEFAPLRQTCRACQQSLEQAAAAWESGDAISLRERLAEYRQATGAVRTELLRLAQ
jgi:hypothetical protein